MRTIRNSFGGLAIIGGLIALSGFIHAQGTTAQVQSISGSAALPDGQIDSVVRVVAESQGLSLVSPDQIPRFGTFWIVSGAQLPAPLPFLPPEYDPASIPVFSLGPDGQFLVDSTGGAVPQPNSRQAMLGVSTATLVQAQVDALLGLIGQVQGAQANQLAQAMNASSPPVPGNGGDNGGTNSYFTSNYTAHNYGTNLWIANFALSSNNAVGVISNTTADVSYEIQYKHDLAATQWLSAGFVLGSEVTNWTTMVMTNALSHTNNLFLSIRSWADDGSGLPIWWQLDYFGTTGTDPYGNPSGDGWNNLYKFQHGMNPNQFYTPPAPQGLTVSYHPSNNTATISWQPSAGSVTGYTVTRNTNGIVTTFNFSANTTSFTDSTQPQIPNLSYWRVGPVSYNPTYQVQAQYTGNHSSATSAAVNLLSSQNSVSINLVPGSQSTEDLVVSRIPQNTATIHVTRMGPWDIMGNPQGDTSATIFDIPVNSLTNGIYPLSLSQVVPPDGYTYAWWAQITPTNGSPSAATGPTQTYSSETPFYDGRVQLKQNLIFLLRAGFTNTPFQYKVSGYLYSNPSNYAYADFYHAEEGGDALEPFADNFLYRNFVFSLADVDANGRINTGVSDDDYGLVLQGTVYQFQPPTTNWITVPALLGTNVTRWLSSFPMDWSPYGLGEIGVTFGPGLYMLDSNARNIFGLPFRSAELAYNSSGQLGTNTLYAGGSITNWASPIYFYPETAQPQFQTVEYDFWQPYPGPLPGMTSFSPTNTSQLIITPVGNLNLLIAGYAKLAVTNGYSGVYGYLGQYFDKAYTEDTNGMATTNSAGILSAYGNFFPMVPGPAALVTMPDIDTGQRGTGTVYCVSLVLDKNHDGTMDGSFNGPDATSQASPMEWWINDDYDYSGASWNLGQDLQSGWYYNDGYQRKIDSQRDLEDYARLWICGMPALTNGNYQVTLSWANVSSGNPTINLFDTVETNGGIGYLTNLVTATAEAYNYGIWGENRSAIATISPGQPFTIPASYFTNAGDKHFLFDGAITNGAGELMLTIADGNGNTIAQTGAWLDLHHIDDFFEQAVITNNMSGAKSNWTSSVEIVQPAVSSALGDDQDLIVLVHGINVKPWDCVNDAETVCKRLYWAGYHGKFAEVEWPCNLLTPIPSPLSPAVFNDSELQGYKASQALTTYLTQLRARFPGYRLHLLVHSQGNAVVSEAIRSGVTFDTYILTQGALPASAYDVNAPVDNDIASYEGSRPTPEWQPMGYRGIYTNFTGRIVNFYNSQDGVLNYWVTDQKLLKPSVYFDTSYYFYNGTNSYFDPPFSANYLVTDPEESRADVSRSRTLPIGQSGPASGHGVIQSAVDLNANFGFNSDISEHSAQWTRPIQTSRPYFQQVLRSCQIIPAP